MFKRANKITALLVAAASVMSIVPAMAADSTRLGTKDGTIEKAVAFDGKYIYEGYKGDSDKAVYFNNGDKDKELTDFEDYTFTGATYGDKYTVAEDGSDDYLVDLTNGSVTDDTIDDKLDSTASKLEKAIKKTDKYDGQTVATGDLTKLVSYSNFQQPWYSVVKNGNTIFADENGKYVDSSVLANIYAYSSEKGKNVKIEKFGKAYTDTKLTAVLTGAPTVIAQDKDNIYAVVNVKITDSSSKVKAEATKETYTVTTSSAVSINGTSYANINDVFAAASDAFSAKYDVTKSGVTVKLTAKTAGVVSSSDSIAALITGASVSKVAGSSSSVAGTPQDTYAWYLQKISKAQGDTDEEAYEPKTVTSYQIDNKSLYDNGDVSDAYSWLINGTSVDTANILNVEVKDSTLYVYKKNSAGDNVKVNKLDLKQIKENPVDKTVYGDTKLDGYVVKKDGDTDQDYDALTVDVNGITWVLNDGKIIKFAEKDKTTVYTCDSGFDSLSVYDAKNLIAWSYSDERYTTVTEGTKVTQDEASVVAPVIVTGWVQAADGSWSFNDATGAKVASKWINVGGAWYYLKADGVMATGWYNDNGTWYYLKSSGAMATGWLNDNGTWYYLNASGAMLANTTVDGYVLGASGAWVK